MRFVIAAGGTGGHLFPGIAVGEVLIAAGHEVMLLVSEKEIDAVATKGVSGFQIEKIAGMGMPKIFSPAIITFALRFWKALRHVKKLYRQFQPAAVLGMGGFTSTAPILAGRSRKVPTFVHDSNAIPGRANKLNARYVSKVLLGFKEGERYFPNAQCEVTGTPIRTGFLKPLDKAAARSGLGLSPDKKTLLVMGGSQGAHGINSVVEKTLPELVKLGLQFIHLTGKSDEAALKAAYEKVGATAHVAAFCSRMEEVYSASDFVIARSGAATLAELSHVGLPSILIPYPFAADDHQTANAEIFERGGASFLVQESAASPQVLLEKVSRLMDQLSAMTQQCRALAHDDAAKRVAEIVLKSVTP